MSLLISHFWTATVLTFLKNGLELLKEKALKTISLTLEEPKHKVRLRVAERITISEIVSHFN